MNQQPQRSAFGMGFGGAIGCILLFVSLPLSWAMAGNAADDVEDAAVRREKRLAVLRAQYEASRAAGVAQLEEYVADGEKRLAEVRKGIVRKRPLSGGRAPSVQVFKTVQEKAKAVEKAEASLFKMKADLEAAKTSPGKIPYLRPPLEVGSVGTIPGRRCRIEQVLRKDAAVITVFMVGPSSIERIGTTFVERRSTVETQVILRGIPTDNFADDAEVELRGTFEVVGTENGTIAVGGLRTLFVIERFSEREEFLPPEVEVEVE